jgi:hypothetical protein
MEPSAERVTRYLESSQGSLNNAFVVVEGDMGMERCDACESTGHQLWMRNGKPKFAPCCVCDAEGTIFAWHFGAAPMPPFVREIRMHGHGQFKG